MNNIFKIFKEKELTLEEGVQEEQRKIVRDFKAKIEGNIPKDEKEKELTPEQAAEKKQKENKMFESLAEEALCKGLLDSRADPRQLASSNVGKAVEWLKLNGRSFEDSREWIKDKIKELAKEAKKEKDKRKIELCRELKNALRSFNKKK